MKIPLSYIVRSLWQRKTATLLTVSSFVLVILTLIALLATVKGIEATLIETGNPTRLVIINKNASFETQSKMTESDGTIIGAFTEIKLSPDAKPLTSFEVLTTTFADSLDGQQVQVNLRGLDMPQALAVRDEIKLIAGKMFASDSADEVVLGRGIADGMGVSPGDFIIMKQSKWKVAGVFTDNGSPCESEIWTSRTNVELTFKKTYLSSVWVKVRDTSQAKIFSQKLNDDKTVSIYALTEQEYYSRGAETANNLKILTWFVAVIMSVAAISSAMNTMYASVADRSKELGTIRAIGFQDSAVLQAVVLEAVIQSVFGGLVASLVALLLNGVAFKMEVVSFGIIVFRLNMTLDVITIGLVFSLILGLAGGWLPARNATRENIIDALKG